MSTGPTPGLPFTSVSTGRFGGLLLKTLVTIKLVSRMGASVFYGDIQGVKTLVTI